MKLLLTSAGIQNKSLADALIEMVGKPVGEISVGLVSTAMSPEKGHKEWFIKQFTNLQKYGFVSIDIIDVAAPEIKWQDRLSVVDVVFVSGGNTYYLLDQTRKTGFGDWLKANLEQKVYVGVSAGSILVTPTIGVAAIPPGDHNFLSLTDLEGLGLVDFEVSVHTPELVTHESNKEYAKTMTRTLYGLDDQSAIKVDNGELEFISEGHWIKY